MGTVHGIKGELFVYEAVQPVKLTKFKDWINREKNGDYVIKRLVNSDKILTQETLI